jgi:1,4-dihydroxy-2-naphthoate octaprenyltransferase
MPVFLFALSQADGVSWMKVLPAFIVLHVFVFPSSNGYNSYQDRDETSIGGLKNPPEVSENLFYATLLFDLLGLALAFLLSAWFALCVLMFITMSRLYSYRGVRLKKYPVTAFLTVFIFQGAFVYLMTYAAVTPFPASFFNFENLICMAIASLFIGSMYPLTQIYQHEADRNDGVISISYKLGYRGTFLFSGLLFLVASVLMGYYFFHRGQAVALVLFMLFILPMAVLLGRWFVLVKKDSRYADFENAMKANLVSSASMNLYFAVLVINNQLAIF